MYETAWIPVPLDSDFNFLPSWNLETTINASFAESTDFSQVTTSAEVTWDPQPLDIRGAEGAFADGDYTIDTDMLGFSNNSFPDSRIPAPGAMGLACIGAAMLRRRRRCS